jgi:hypothetical protein
MIKSDGAEGPSAESCSKFRLKAQLDTLLLKLPGVSARKINGLDAYFVSDKMFVCISDCGVGLRLPAPTATELQFSRDDVVPFQPGGMTTSREWIQIDRADAADYDNDVKLAIAKGLDGLGASARSSRRSRHIPESAR